MMSGSLETCRVSSVRRPPRQSAKEIIDLLGSGFSKSAYFRMVLSSWEMVAAFVNYGAIDAGLLQATAVEKGIAGCRGTSDV
jgi:hypothetical protein